MAYNSTSCALSDDEVSVTDSTHSNSLLDCDDSEITFNERLKFCCKPKYQPRKLKNKGAILVLVWNFLITSVFYYMQYKSLNLENYCQICFQLINIPIGVV